MRLVRTVRHLRARQLFAQVALRVRSRVERPAAFARRWAEDFERPLVRLAPRGDWLHPDGEPNGETDLRSGRLRFVGIEHSCGCPPRWGEREAPRLWRYNLHYHGFLYGLEYETARACVLDYIARQPLARGAEGWEPYPLSLRLMNWVALFHGRWAERTRADAPFDTRLWLELRRMGEWLRTHLEHHLLANHLFENALALSFAGAAFGGPVAERWSKVGRRLLRDELGEQVLTDGLHYERSPMYQARLTQALGMLWNSGDAELEELVSDPLARMARALRCMTHPNGELALLNDSAQGVYPRTDAIVAWLADLGVPVSRGELRAIEVLPAAGYIAWRPSPDSAYFVDVGAIGPDYQPGHAHADFLALEASVAGLPLFVDGGNKEYVEGPARDFARSVRAHGTVFVDGHEPLELWGAFRVGRRGRAWLEDHRREGANGLRLRARHDGYRHLRGRPIVERELAFRPDGALELRDRVEAAHAWSCVSQLVVDGEWRIERVDARRVRLMRDDACVELCAETELELEPSVWYPRFGVERPAVRILQRFVANDFSRGVGWFVSAPESRATAGAASPECEARGADERATPLRSAGPAIDVPERGDSLVERAAGEDSTRDDGARDERTRDDRPRNDRTRIDLASIDSQRSHLAHEGSTRDERVREDATRDESIRDEATRDDPRRDDRARHSTPDEPASEPDPLHESSADRPLVAPPRLAGRLDAAGAELRPTPRSTTRLSR